MQRVVIIWGLSLKTFHCSEEISGGGLKKDHRNELISRIEWVVFEQFEVRKWQKKAHIWEDLIKWYRKVSTYRNTIKAGLIRSCYFRIKKQLLFVVKPGLASHWYENTGEKWRCGRARNMLQKSDTWDHFFKYFFFVCSARYLGSIFSRIKNANSRHPL